MTRSLCKSIVALAVVFLLVPVANAVVGLDISPTPGPYGGETIEVTPPDTEQLYFHIDDGTDTGLYHLMTLPEIDFVVVPSKPDPPTVVELSSWDVGASQEYTACHWYPLGTISIDGPPCTMIDIVVTMNFGATGGTPTSNVIHKHITPEPASMVILGVGAVGVLLNRRKR